MIKPPRSYEKLREDRGLFAAILVLFGLLGGFFAIMGTLAAAISYSLLAALCGSWITTGLGLLVIWLGLGPGKPAAYLAYLTATLGGVAFLFRIEIVALLSLWLTVTLIAIAVTAGPLQLLDYKIRGVHPGDERARRDSPKANQFSLRQLLAWTIVASLIAAAARIANPFEKEFLKILSVTTAFALVAVLNALVVLMPRRIVTFAFLVIPFCGFVLIVCRVDAYLNWWIDGRNIQTSFFDLDTDRNLLVFAHVLLTSTVLLIFRGLDYRIARRKPDDKNSIMLTQYYDPPSAAPLPWSDESE